MATVVPGAPSDGIEGTPRAIFADVYFVIIPSDELTPEAQENYTNNLLEYGATELSLDSDDLKHITHIIATNCDFEAYYDAIDAMIPVVTPKWIEMAIQRNKAPNPRSFSPDPQHYFRDVIVSFAEDIPVGDKDAIIGGIQAMGGQYSDPLTKLVTHVVALTLDSPKCQVMQAKKIKAVAVLPHWFDDCLKLGRKIKEAPYELPNPSILNSDLDEAPPRSFSSEKLKGSDTMKPRVDALSPSPLPEDKRLRPVFAGKRVMLHNDLGIAKHLESTLKDLVEKHGGHCVADIDEANVLVCHHRESAEYTKAFHTHKDIGNLNWLYFLLNRGKYSNPMSRLLHYPYPKDGITGFKNAKITISNYTGEARSYLDALIQAAGGQFTKNMTTDNDYLITAHLYSEKCNAATEWGINKVNHIWLEESYAKGKMQTLTNRRYTFFPDRTNLTELVGQTPVDRKTLCMQLGIFDDEDASELVSSPAVNGSDATPAPNSTKQRRKALQTPQAAHLNKENITPGSRGAKDRALFKLHGMAGDIALYEKERKRVGGVVYGGRRVNDADRISLDGTAARGRKRSVDEVDAEPGENDELTAEDTTRESSPKPKRQKKDSKKKGTASARSSTGKVDSEQFPPLKVLVTGVDKDNIPKPSSCKWADLNITLVETPDEGVDVIVSERIVRTPKWLVGLASAPTIATMEWLETMAEQAGRVSPSMCPVKDKDWENSHGVAYTEVSKRAAGHKEEGGLLRGCSIYLLPTVKGGFDLIAGIIRAHGGVAIQWGGRQQQVPELNEEDIPEEEEVFGDAEMYLVGEAAEKSIWKKVKSIAAQQNLRPHIRRTEWLLTMVELQTVDVPIKDDWELSEKV